MSTKKCGMCKLEKTLKSFNKNQNRCRSCQKKVRAERSPDKTSQYNEQKRIAANAKYHTDEEFRKRLLQEQREYRLKYPEKDIFRHAKKRAPRKGLEFNITESDVIIPDRCPLLGIELKVGKDSITDNSPTLDRIDNSKGYIKGNVWVISNRANRIKNCASLEEFRMILKNWEAITSG